MIKGGFQGLDISGVDLTAPTLSVEGLSKACANANGKAVLIKMPDGTEAFGAVKGVTGGYQLSVMGADSKVREFNVDDTDDSFTMLESVALADDATYRPDWGDRINLFDYTAEAPYTAPCDGYFSGYVAKTNNSTGDAVSLYLITKNGNSSGASTDVLYYNSAGNAYRKIFIKKGIKIYATAEGTGTGTKQAAFMPLTSA